MDECEQLARLVFEQLQGKSEADQIRVIAVGFYAIRKSGVDIAQQELGRSRLAIERQSPSGFYEWIKESPVDMGFVMELLRILNNA